MADIKNACRSGDVRSLTSNKSARSPAPCRRLSVQNTRYPVVYSLAVPYNDTNIDAMSQLQAKEDASELIAQRTAMDKEIEVLEARAKELADARDKALDLVRTVCTPAWLSNGEH